MASVTPEEVIGFIDYTLAISGGKVLQFHKPGKHYSVFGGRVMCLDNNTSIFLRDRTRHFDEICHNIIFDAEGNMLQGTSYFMTGKYKEKEIHTQEKNKVKQYLSFYRGILDKAVDRCIDKEISSKLQQILIKYE